MLGVNSKLRAAEVMTMINIENFDKVEMRVRTGCCAAPTV